MTTKDIFSKNLQHHMKNERINNRELAKILGVSESTVGKWILKKTFPRMNIIDKLAKFFKITPSDLLEDKREQNLSIALEKLEDNGFHVAIDNEKNFEVAVERNSEYEYYNYYDFIDNSLKIAHDIVCSTSPHIDYQSYPYIPEGVSAGIPNTIDGLNELPTISLPKSFLGEYSARSDILLLKVNGGSMNRVIQDGSWIAILKDYDIKNLKDGDVVVFNYDYEYSLKEYYDLGNEILFKPNSTELIHKEIRRPKTEDLKIEGKVIMYNIIL